MCEFYAKGTIWALASHCTGQLIGSQCKSAQYLCRILFFNVICLDFKVSPVSSDLHRVKRWTLTPSNRDSLLDLCSTTGWILVTESKRSDVLLDPKTTTRRHSENNTRKAELTNSIGINRASLKPVCRYASVPCDTVDCI